MYADLSFPMFVVDNETNLILECPEALVLINELGYFNKNRHKNHTIPFYLLFLNVLLCVHFNSALYLECTLNPSLL